MSTLLRLPAPIALDPAYPVHEPEPDDQQDAVRALAASHDWAQLPWPDLAVPAGNEVRELPACLGVLLGRLDAGGASDDLGPG